ncbi:helix-turn-helix domain-containing protein [Marinobacterium stanieri]|uniref:Helix-turn-helix n=1 Tax=Marinobacterium stanieri TaxID=49186 RepID=A0A1N6PCI5_9GAMM|nr:helix-turn-helix transcriptional regulator [Marinobacterium stanieri]SIQ01946.1 Helix-turn-helix [Marinobacterium stanieri]
MSYVTEPIVATLREARVRKGLSQRELSARSGVPQSHISKIESGSVDLRVSSLIALARVLDLELLVAPKKSVPAIQSIIRSSSGSGTHVEGEQVSPAYLLDEEDDD